MSAKRKATAQSGKSALKKQAGRPAKKHCIDDAVRMVSALFEKRGLNVRHFLLGDCINVFQSSCRINFFYGQFVLGILCRLSIKICFTMKQSGLVVCLTPSLDKLSGTM